MKTTMLLAIAAALITDCRSGGGETATGTTTEAPTVCLGSPHCECSPPEYGPCSGPDELDCPEGSSCLITGESRTCAPTCAGAPCPTPCGAPVACLDNGSCVLTCEVDSDCTDGRKCVQTTGKDGPVSLCSWS